MWLGDISVGDPNADPNAATPAASSASSDVVPFVNLAANLVSAIKPYGQGVPVNVAISPQTQSFLMMGGLFIGGLVILNMLKR
jgi:hypothetical protein